MMIKINVWVIFVLFLSATMFGCKEEKVEPINEVPSKSLPEISMNGQFSKASIDTVIDKSSKDVGFKLVFHNNELSSDAISDSVFIWEILSINKPENWQIAVCDPIRCNDYKATSAEFNLAPGKTGKFQFDFYLFDANFNSQPLGEGTANIVYVVYRKGMSKENGAKFQLTITTR